MSVVIVNGRLVRHPTTELLWLIWNNFVVAEKNANYPLIRKKSYTIKVVKNDCPGIIHLNISKYPLLTSVKSNSFINVMVEKLPSGL